MKKFNEKYLENQIKKIEKFKEKNLIYINNNNHIQDVNEYNKRNRIQREFNGMCNKLKLEIEEFEKIDEKNKERVKKFFLFK